MYLGVCVAGAVAVANNNNNNNNNAGRLPLFLELLASCSVMYVCAQLALALQSQKLLAFC